MATVLTPIPTEDFDPTEAAVPWKIAASARALGPIRNTGREPTAEPMRGW